jgi:nucleoside-diphosphate-sugar epimerase
MQTILGAGGRVGLELARILPEYTETVRLVSRNPKKVNPHDKLYPADLLNPDDVAGAAANSDIVYLMAGLPYRARLWESHWPVIMANVIDSCRKSGSKLVFFDNVYMYDREHLGSMDEDTPVRPTSRKGRVRAEIADQLMAAVQSADVEGLIARCADFYGPGKPHTSVLTVTVFERLAAGKAAQWLLADDCAHSFTFVPDAARGTGRQWIEAIASQLDAEPRVQVVSRPLLTMLGLAIPDLRELREMAYQYDRDYDFRSDKFNQRFSFQPTAYEQGIRTIVEADYR